MPEGTPLIEAAWQQTPGLVFTLGSKILIEVFAQSQCMTIVTSEGQFSRIGEIEATLAADISADWQTFESNGNVILRFEFTDTTGSYQVDRNLTVNEDTMESLVAWMESQPEFIKVVFTFAADPGAVADQSIPVTSVFNPLATAGGVGQIVGSQECN